MSFLLRCKISEFEGLTEETILDYVEAVRNRIDLDNRQGSVTIDTATNHIRIIDKTNRLNASFACDHDSIMIEIPDIGYFNRKVHLDGCFLFLDKKQLAEILALADYTNNSLVYFSTDTVFSVRFINRGGFISLRQFLMGTSEVARALFESDRKEVIKDLIYDFGICGNLSYDRFLKRGFKNIGDSSISVGEMLEIVEIHYPGIKEEIRNELELSNSIKLKRDQQELQDWLTELTFTYTESKILFTLQGSYSYLYRHLEDIALRVYMSGGELKLPTTPYVEITERLNNAYAKVCANQEQPADILVEEE